MRTACCRVPDLPLAARLRAKAVASPALERTAREALLDAALSLSPRAALVPRASGAFAAEAAVPIGELVARIEQSLTQIPEPQALPGPT